VLNCSSCKCWTIKKIIILINKTVYYLILHEIIVQSKLIFKNHVKGHVHVFKNTLNKVACIFGRNDFLNVIILYTLAKEIFSFSK